MHPSSQHCYWEVGDGGALEAHWPASLCRLKLSNRPDLREDVRQDQCLRLYSDFHTRAMGLVCPRLPTLTSITRQGVEDAEEEKRWRGREIENVGESCPLTIPYSNHVMVSRRHGHQMSRYVNRQELLAAPAGSTWHS